MILLVIDTHYESPDHTVPELYNMWTQLCTEVDIPLSTRDPTLV